MNRINKYKVNDGWKKEAPKLGKDEFITALICFKALLLYMLYFFAPIFGFLFIVAWFSGVSPFGCGCIPFN